jgi:hypothetical protein
LINAPFPTAVLEALDYMASTAPATSGILDIRAVMIKNVRLVEVAMVIWEWRKTSIVEENNTNKNNKITIRNIFGQMGRATREQALAMLKAKEDEKVEAGAVAVVKKYQAMDKIAKDTNTALVTTGLEILKRLEQLGLSELLRLKTDKLHAMFVNADPNKKTR